MEKGWKFNMAGQLERVPYDFISVSGYNKKNIPDSITSASV
jgi:hypothetical protein